MKRAHWFLLVTLLVGVAGDLDAAENFDCGSGGKPDAKTARCICPPGKSESTMGGVSRCVTPTKPAATKKPAATASTSSTMDVPNVLLPPPAEKIAVVGPCPASMVPLPAVHVERDGAIVESPAFCLQKSPVTVKEYLACAEDSACPPAAKEPYWDGIVAPASMASGCNANDPIARARHPMNCVDYNEARLYCAWIGARLPTADEMTWAAQGAGAKHTYAWGDGAPPKQTCWSGLFARSTTCPVGFGGPTALGLTDLAGNVWEWTSTRESPGDSPLYEKGGSFETDEVSRLRADARFLGEPWDHRPALGFRCAEMQKIVM